MKIEGSNHLADVFDAHNEVRLDQAAYRQCLTTIVQSSGLIERAGKVTSCHNHVVGVKSGDTQIESSGTIDLNQKRIIDLFKCECVYLQRICQASG